MGWPRYPTNAAIDRHRTGTSAAMTEFVRTAALDLAYEVSGPDGGRPVLAVHGWPDDPRTWEGCLGLLDDEGFRVYRPYLRGFGPTRFRRESTMRSGQLSALTQDIAELIEVLALEDPILVGHDWGARAGYGLAATRPELVSALVAMSVGYASTGPDASVSPEQARAYWYQWYFSTEVGRRAITDERRDICRLLWSRWFASGEFEEHGFEATAASWDNPDWAEVTIHSYSQRWGEAEVDPDLADLEEELAKGPKIAVPTIVLHGEDDRATLVDATAGKNEYFTASYERRLLPGIGHFVPREAPDAVVDAILALG
jgi:pimeloyl-ACP methyl ester carboxylesterase